MKILLIEKETRFLSIGNINMQLKSIFIDDNIGIKFSR